MSFYEEYKAKPLTERQLEIIRNGIKTMEEKIDLDVKPLPAFEASYRARKGVNIKFDNNVKRYTPVSDEERKIKAGSGRKAKTVKNIYHKTINENFKSYYLQRNLDCLLVAATRQFTDKKGKPEVSYSTLKHILVNEEEINAKILMDDLWYSKTQAYRIFNVYKWIINMNVNLLEE